MTSIPHSRITRQLTQVTLSSLIEQLTRGELEIPPHQRQSKSWKDGRKSKFIMSILKGYPIPSILISSKRVGSTTIHTLEDGLQRITTAKLFRENQFDCEGRRYSQLTDIQRERFDTEGIAVITFSNATDSDRIQIFDWHQNGLPLAPGERYHAQSETPLVKFTKRALMTPGMGYHDRAVQIWGIRGDYPGVETKDNRRRWLLNAIALVKGLRFGPANTNKKYEPDSDHMTAEITPAMEIAIYHDLERIFQVYEEVEAAVPSAGKKFHNHHWDLGTFTGYILYSLSADRREAYIRSQEEAGVSEMERMHFECMEAEYGGYIPNSLANNQEDWDYIKSTWVNYMSSIRRTIQNDPNKKLTDLLKRGHQKGLSKARSWTLQRWEDGYNRMFHPDRVINTSLGEEEEDDEENSD
jgi:hypothetical protein